MKKTRESLREKLRQHRLLQGAFLCCSDPTVAEVMSQADFDLLIVDAEHSAFGPAQIQTLVRAVEAGGVACLVRVPELLQSQVQWALDSGAQGILFPQIRHAEDTRRAVSFCRYPPQGQRGLGPGRASGWGSYLGDYQNTANDELAVLIQIENLEALENLEAIISVPGIDMIFIGPGDLSQVLGVSGQLEHPKVVSAMQEIVEACQAQDVAVGTLTLTESSALHWKEAGASLLILGSDTMFLGSSAHDVAKNFRSIHAEKE